MNSPAAHSLGTRVGRVSSTLNGVDVDWLRCSFIHRDRLEPGVRAVRQEFRLYHRRRILRYVAAGVLRARVTLELTAVSPWDGQYGWLGCPRYRVNSLFSVLSGGAYGVEQIGRKTTCTNRMPGFLRRILARVLFKPQRHPARHGGPARYHRRETRKSTPTSFLSDSITAWTRPRKTSSWLLFRLQGSNAYIYDLPAGTQPR